MSNTTKMVRDEILAVLVERDGDICMYPGCGNKLDFNATGKKEVTIDHWMPQSWCYDKGWTTEQVWDTSNLKLMEKECNAKKGSLLPNPDGTLPPREVTQRERRADKSNRPTVCLACDSGRKLGPGDVCGACGSGPMPEAFPGWAKMKSTECDHDLFWCWACSIGLTERRPASADVFGVLD
jgi:hypothetical protein